MKFILSILLLAGSVLIGYQGAVILTDTYKTIKIGELNLSSNKKSDKNEGFIYLGSAVALLLGGAYLMRSKKIVKSKS
jgi:hypothetical protein